MPDNQEVFVNPENNQSIIVDILEAVPEADLIEAVKWVYSLVCYLANLLRRSEICLVDDQVCHWFRLVNGYLVWVFKHSPWPFSPWCYLNFINCPVFLIDLLYRMSFYRKWLPFPDLLLQYSYVTAFSNGREGEIGLSGVRIWNFSFLCTALPSARVVPAQS